MRGRSLTAVRVAAGLVLLLVGRGPAFGQGETWAGPSLAQMIERAPWRLGALRINAAFSLSNAGYDSDIYYGYLSAPAPDLSFTAGASVQVLLPLGKNVVLDIADSPRYMFYLDSRNERGLNNAFRGQVHFAFERVYIQLGGGLSNIRYRLSPELNINVRQKQEALTGLILWQVSKITSLAVVGGTAAYDLGEAEFEGIRLSDSLNRRETYLDLFTYVQPTTRVRLFIDGQYGRYAFAIPEFRTRDARSYGLFGGVEFIPRSQGQEASFGIAGGFRLGYQRLDFIDPRFANGSGLTGGSSIVVTLGRKTTARGFLSRGFQFSIFSGSTSFLTTAYGGGISRFLSRKATLSYDISYGTGSYPASEALPGIFNRFITHAFGLDFRLGRRLSLGLLANLGKRILDSSGLARNRNYFGLNLIYGSPAGTVPTPTGGIALGY
jgi:hypothetical protein